MKKLTFVLICVMILTSLASICVNATDVTYTAPYTASRPVIDGKADDAVWANAPQAVCSIAWSGNAGTTTAPTFRLLHDDNHIFIVVEYVDPNGTIPQVGKHYGQEWKLGAENAIIAFIDDARDQKEFMFTSPEDKEGALSTNTYINVMRQWQKNLSNVEDGEDGYRAWATRSNKKIVWEMQIPKDLIGAIDDTVTMEISVADAALPDRWLIESWGWGAEAVTGGYMHILTPNNFGTLILAAEGVAVDPTPVVTAPVETEPTETEPAETEPVETEPTETEPTETEPVETEPTETEPAETEPVETEPTETEPTETEPVETEPTETEPKETEKADEPKDTAKDEAPTTTAADAEEPMEKGGFPVIPVVIAAAVVLVIVIAVLVLKKKKK